MSTPLAMLGALGNGGHRSRVHYAQSHSWAEDCKAQIPPEPPGQPRDQTSWFQGSWRSARAAAPSATSGTGRR